MYISIRMYYICVEMLATLHGIPLSLSPSPLFLYVPLSLSLPSSPLFFSLFPFHFLSSCHSPTVDPFSGVSEALDSWRPTRLFSPLLFYSRRGIHLCGVYLGYYDNKYVSCGCRNISGGFQQEPWALQSRKKELHFPMLKKSLIFPQYIVS